MKKWLLLYCLAGMLSCLKGQTWRSSALISRNAIYIPDSISRSSAAIARFVQEKYTIKEDQLQVLYNWVINNIRYEVDSSYYFNWSVDAEAKIAATLRRRSGVCENFAALFADLATRIGVPAFVVHGYADGSGSRNVAHSWCAVQLGDDWHLCDPTWDAVSPGDTRYFFMGPREFVSAHIPFDPMWQLLEKPVGYDTGEKNAAIIFNYKDSIKTFLASDSLQRLFAIERRMQKLKINNSRLLKTWQSYNRMNIVIMGQEENMNLYNAAVENYNQAIILFNEFITYRNNGFLPVKPDTAIENMLVPIEGLLNAAQKKLEGIGRIAENFQYDTEELSNKIQNLVRRREEQKAYLKKYFSSRVSHSTASGEPLPGMGKN